MTLPIRSDSEPLTAAEWNEIVNRIGGASTGIPSLFVSNGDASYFVASDGSIIIPNNVVDIGLALAAAIAALPASGGEIIVPRGTYTCTTPVVTSKANVLIRGSGIGTTITKGANGAIITATGNHFRLRDINFNGNAANYTGVGLSITGQESSLLDVVVTQTADAGLDVPSGATSIEIIGGRYNPTDASVFSIPGIRIGNVSEVSSPRIIGVTSRGQLTIEVVRVDNGVIADCDGVQFKWGVNAKKVRFIGNRVANGVEGTMTVEGTDHTILGNIFAQGGLTLGATTQNCHVGFNRSVVAMVNNGANNTIMTDTAGVASFLSAASFLAAVTMLSTLGVTGASTFAAQATFSGLIKGDRATPTLNAPSMQLDAILYVSRQESFVDLDATPRDIMGGVTFSSCIIDFWVATPDGDTGTFSVYCATEAGVLHRFVHVGGANCTVTETSEGVFAVSGMGDGRIYTITLTTGSATGTIKADAATVGTTKLAYFVRKGL